MRKLVILINRCCIALTLALLPLTARAGGAGLVTTDGTHFRLGGAEYRYVGQNLWYGAILASTGCGGDTARLRRELDRLRSLGCDNVRVLVGGDGRDGIPSHIAPKLQTAPGVYNDTLLTGLDRLLSELERRGMRCVLYFNNAWEWSGGYGAYLDWAGHTATVQGGDGRPRHFNRTPVPTLDGWWEYMQYAAAFLLNDRARAMSLRHVERIVTRRNTITGGLYRDSPAIMAWEIANEPRAFINDTEHREAFVSYIDETSRLIKRLDPNHLVTTGSEGKHGCEEDIALFRRIHSLPCIDYACIHIWPNNWGWIGKFNQNYDSDKTIAEGAPDPIRDNVRAAIDSTDAYIGEARAAIMGKPLVLEEFGYPRDRFLFTPGSPTEGRDTYFRHVFRLIAETNLIAGCNVWGWGGEARPPHTVWQRWDPYTGDPAQEEQGLNSVFDNDTTTLEIIKAAASAIKQR